MLSHCQVADIQPSCDLFACHAFDDQNEDFMLSACQAKDDAEVQEMGAATQDFGRTRSVAQHLSGRPLPACCCGACAPSAH